MLQLAPTLGLQFECASNWTLEAQPYHAARIHNRPFKELSELNTPPNSIHAPYKVKDLSELNVRLSAIHTKISESGSEE